MKTAIGMRRGGAIWWDNSAEWVGLMKQDGPVVIIGLDERGRPEYPELARILKTATLATMEGVGYRDMHNQLTEQGAQVEGFWGTFAAALLHVATKEKLG